ncbi:MAG: SCP2 sterol-binding domain-containing protein [Paraglaciecola sp.]|uniref:ubiquinone biosynthesis accessory factor UbiJ n=1 Tax=Paraglaciecola sp. TaxID=1920173 RepID=UPI003299AA15
MPIAQLLTSGIELGFNQLLNLDTDSQARLAKLNGKSLQVSVKELPFPLLFNFSEQVEVGAVVESNEHNQAPDCLIELDLNTLPKLQDSSQLTQLIQQKKLSLIGDIYIAQTFGDLIKELDIDWEEQLSKYTGDVVAHQTFSSAKSLLSQAKQELEKAATNIGDRMTQADAIAVKPIEMALFSDQVGDLRSDTERLLARLQRLEQAQADSKG